MTSDRRKRAEDLFQAAADLPPDDRADLLEGECGADAELRSEVERLLRAHENDADDRLGDGGLTALWSPDPGESPGDVIGPYTLVSLLGEGGMGMVYLAEQSEPVQRRVALKIIKLGMDTREVTARFDAERQALALMDHPNVARVIDAGATSTGRPYFVMDLVSGIPITEHCDQNRLGIDARLDLFMQVCDAVQHAHQKGIIHRDLKPSNILVTFASGAAVPKVIDFGVAKALHRKLAEDTVFTEQGQMIGTPEYMSPEQAEMSAQDIDTRSDVYSLGVLLYELLTGERPFSSETLRAAGLAEIQRIIREEDPPKPSTRLSELEAASSTDHAAHRHADPRTLVRTLRGDLDWIVMKCLEKERDRRYATASALAGDIRRHLEHEPVLAGPPSAAYRFQKFLRRNRVGVTAAALVALAVLAGAVGVLVQSSRIADEARATESVNDFFNRMFASVDPMQFRLFAGFDAFDDVVPIATAGSGRDLRVAEMLLATSPGIESAFAGRPALQANAHETLGLTLESLGHYERAEGELRRALALRSDVLRAPDDDPDLIRSKLLLGYAIWDARRGQYRESLELVADAVDGLVRTHGPDDPRTLNATRVLAVVLSYDWKFEESEPLFERTLAGQRRVRGRTHPDTLMTLFHWSLSSLWQGRHARGERQARELRSLCAEALSADHIIWILADMLVGDFCQYRGRFDEAEVHTLAALTNSRDALGEDHPLTHIMMRVHANSVYGSDPIARLDEAVDLARGALEGHRDAFGPEHRETYFSSSAYSALLRRQGDPDTAIDAVHIPAVEGFTHSRGDENIISVMALSGLVRALGGAGRHIEAQSWAARMIDAIQGLSSRSRVTPFELHICASSLLVPEVWKPARAVRLAEKAVALADEEMLGERFDGETAYLVAGLVRAQVAAEDIDAASATAVRLLRILLASDPAPSELGWAASIVVLGRELDASAYASAALAGEHAVAVDPTSSHLATLGAAQLRLGELEAVLETMRRCAEVHRAETVLGDALTALAYHGLGRAEEARGALARLNGRTDEVPLNTVLTEALAAEARSIVGGDG